MAAPIPLISIVVPVRNRAGVVTATLDSIAAQTFMGFELIVVDNGSTDGSPEVLEEWKRRNAGCGFEVRLTSCAKPGAAAARNAGMAIAKAPWLMFFDSDDLMLPWHLERVAGGIQANPDACVIGWDVEIEQIDGTKRTGRFFGHDMQRHNLFDGAMATQRWTAPTAFVRSVGGWDEGVGYWDDIELGSRLLARAETLPDIAKELWGKVYHMGAGGVRVIASRDSITSAGARDPRSAEAALTRIERTLGAKGRRWCRLKRVIEYALASRSGLPAGRACMRQLTRSPLLWAAYHYTRLGGRGVARLLP